MNKKSLTVRMCQAIGYLFLITDIYSLVFHLMRGRMIGAAWAFIELFVFIGVIYLKRWAMVMASIFCISYLCIGIRISVLTGTASVASIAPEFLWLIPAALTLLSWKELEGGFNIRPAPEIVTSGLEPKKSRLNMELICKSLAGILFLTIVPAALYCLVTLHSPDAGLGSQFPADEVLDKEFIQTWRATLWKGFWAGLLLMPVAFGVYRLKRWGMILFSILGFACAFWQMSMFFSGIQYMNISDFLCFGFPIILFLIPAILTWFGWKQLK